MLRSPLFNGRMLCCAAWTKPMRILVVEDERKLAELIARALRAERYAVDTVHDGHAAWEMLETYEYDLV
ncbi:MAG: response regulator, partial [Steroidobacteraceae bacterium]